MSDNQSDYVAGEKHPSDAATQAPSHDDIARLAHALWQERGGGDGGAEEDWLEAERMFL